MGTGGVELQIILQLVGERVVNARDHRFLGVIRLVVRNGLFAIRTV
jgi:hypothetical protein